MASIFEKFNKTIDVAGLKEDIKNGGGDFEELADGKYEAKPDKLEMVVNKKGNPMVVCVMKVIAGKDKGRLMFINFVLTTGFGISRAIEFIGALDSGVDIVFDNFVQFEGVIGEVSDWIKEGGTEYAIEKTTNDRGYTEYAILEVFDAK